jgi:hypothetical protein
MPPASVGFSLGLSFDMEYGGDISLRNVRVSPNCRYYNTIDRTSYSDRRGSLKSNTDFLGLLNKCVHYTARDWRLNTDPSQEEDTA